MKSVVLFTIIFFSLLGLAVSGFAKPPAGNLMGFVYGEDGKTPVQDAMVLIRAVDTGKIYRSKPTGEFGTYKLLGIDPGTYAVGLKIKEKSYNVNDYVKVASGKTSIISLLLVPAGSRWEISIKHTVKEEEEEEEKKKKGFFDTPTGIITLIGGPGVFLLWGPFGKNDEECPAPSDIGWK